MMRRVKKTTNEQFDLLKAEMAIHPAAARGYGVGAQRAVVDAEWKDIVEKLNALGPPERTMTEWKKVWSDVRLRMKKQSMKKAKKPKKPKIEQNDPEEDKLMEALNSSISIYDTHIKNEHTDDDEDTQAVCPDNESYENFDEEEHTTMENTSFYEKNCQQILHETPALQQQNDTVEQTLASLQQQLEQQNILMNHLLKVSTNMALIMERHLKAEERKTSIMERQLKLTEYNNLFLRRQEARRKIKTKNLKED